MGFSIHALLVACSSVKIPLKNLYPNIGFVICDYIGCIGMLAIDLKLNLSQRIRTT